MAYANGGGYATSGNMTQGPVTLQGPADAQRPVSMVMSSLQTRSNDVTELHQVIDELERRLADVMRPVPPTGAMSGGKPDVAPVCCEVVGHLDRVGSQIAIARNRLSALIDRLEV
jgi:hypothetical protein